MQPTTDSLTERIQNLSAEQLAEVEEFVDSLQSGAKLSATLSEPAFAAIWANPEDDVYNRL